jgi:hypothetical protein
MASIRRRSLAFQLAGYIAQTLAEIQRNAGPFALHATAREVVVAHAGHWTDLLAKDQYRALELETERVQRMLPGFAAELQRYCAACLDVIPAALRPPLQHVDVSALVACVWHHVHAAAARGVALDDAACRECANLALKSVRDIVRAHAAARAAHDPYEIARFVTEASQ